MAVPQMQRVIIGITGGIAAYKSLSLIRLFKTHGCEVRVVATANALQFVTPLSIETLSQNRLYTNQFECNFSYEVDHISLADWADVMVVAPATANIIGKYAHGIADDFLSTLLLAFRKPLFFAPAMNDKMYAHPSVQQNIQLLKERGCRMIDPTSGDLACGTYGIGRMEEPDMIFASVCSFFNANKPLLGKKALVTAGPTYEPIDPVRFIGNYSSGLMGFELAQALSDKGAEVTLITGPTALQISVSSIHRIDVLTAAEMRTAVMQKFPEVDIAIMAAAVADYTPENPATNKIKKNQNQWQLPLTKTVDILAEMGKNKRSDQVLVGFALETDHELEHAFDKLENKNADFIVLNSLQDEGAGFKCKTNRVTIINKYKDIIRGELKDKAEVAADIVDIITATPIQK